MSHLFISPLVLRAIKAHTPVVALESTVITHGLPYPENLQLAKDMESQVFTHGATPATIAVLDGKILVGLEEHQFERLAHPLATLQKISTGNLAPALVQRASGGTTVAATLLVAHEAGIQIFATGGIGGVHRSNTANSCFTFDISADLLQLAHTPCIVVCAGAKAILDLPATLEVLETLSVPVVGYQSNEFPAFYSRTSGLPVTVRADSPDEIANIARTHWLLGLNSAILVVNPPPIEAALSFEKIEIAIQQALSEAEKQEIHGQAITPFLLNRVSELTDGASLRTNLALLKNNASLGAQIAVKLANQANS